jgi:hypothetical protein
LNEHEVGEAGEDHNYYDFDRQENTSSKTLQQKHEKEDHHGKKNNLVSQAYNN